MIRKLRQAVQTQICVILAAAVLIGAMEVEKLGDRLQIALPVAGLACAFANGEAVSYTLRFIGTNAVVHTFKRGLGDTDINLRPSGGLQGFPSGHTAAAVFGASYLVHECVQRNKVLQGVAIFSGVFVGASRIEAGKHFLFQVMVGALIGWLGERVLVLFRAIRAAMRRFGLLRRFYLGTFRT